MLEGGGFAGVQGTIMQLVKPYLVDNAGHMGRVFLVLCIRDGFFLVQGLRAVVFEGAFSIYRVDVLRKLGAPFSDVYEAYFHDELFGARLRRRGYRIFHKAIVAGFSSGFCYLWAASAF